MKIAGFQKQSFIDYPGKISSVLFTQGCNFRCGYCHNAELVLPERFGKTYDINYIFDYLGHYKHLLDAVCITGGEPTIHKDLPDFISQIRDFDLEVKLDTNGTNPKMIELLISNRQVNFIAMDIKHLLDLESYNKVVGNCISLATLSRIKETIKLLKSSGIAHQFRTTVLKSFHSKGTINLLQTEFNCKLQQFNPEKVLDPDNYDSNYILSLN